MPAHRAGQGLSHAKLGEPPQRGGPMSRDPNAIEREIEETRAELARTVDLIAERLSPRRAAGRGVTKVRESIGGVFQQENGNGQLPVPTLNGEAELTEPHEPRSIHAVPFEP